MQSRTQAAHASRHGVSLWRWWRFVCGNTTLAPRYSGSSYGGTRASCLTSSAPITSRRFRRRWHDGGGYIRARGGGCDGNSRKAGVMNNYAGVLYMQGACIFMQGVVMECMVRLVRLRVGGNFFHTLGSLLKHLSSSHFRPSIRLFPPRTKSVRRLRQTFR